MPGDVLVDNNSHNEEFAYVEENYHQFVIKEPASNKEEDEIERPTL